MSVTQDATSLKYIPQSLSEWTTLLAGSGISNPSIILLCQEASGNLADSSGNGFTFTAAGSPTYQQTVSGWSTKAVGMAEGTSQKFTNTMTGLPDIQDHSLMVFAWMSYPSAVTVADRSIITLGPNFGNQVYLDLGLRSSVNRFIGGNGTSSVAQSGHYNDHLGSSNPFGAVHPSIVQINRTGDVWAVQTDLETITDTTTHNTGSPFGKEIWLGGDNGNTQLSGGCKILYLAAWFNAAAEIDASGRSTLLDRLNNGPPASGGGRIAGSPLVRSSLINSPLINCSSVGTGAKRLLKSRRDRYAQMEGMN